MEKHWVALGISAVLVGAGVAYLTRRKETTEKKKVKAVRKPVADANDLENLEINVPDRTLSQVRKGPVPRKASEMVESNPELPGNAKVWFRTYGCSHNTSDTEHMMGLLQSYGYDLTDKMEEADVCIVNSCTVKNPSQDTAITLVKKAKGLNKGVVLAGCVPQADRTISDFDEVSLLGTHQIDKVVECVEETLKGNKVSYLSTKGMPDLDLPKVRRNRLIEIVAINSGCLGNCSYCKTKQARGVLGSYSIDAIVRRIKNAAAEGVQQVWLTSEDTGAYGRDLQTNIAELMERILAEIPPNVMLRLGMTNPPYMLEHIDRLGKVLQHPQVFEFMHIPVQSGSDDTLEKMVREYTVEEFDRLVYGLREMVPDMTVATDIICGFPTETDENHEETLELIRRHKFPILNISQFYARPGTAAAKMRKINSAIVKQRSREVTSLFESYRTYDHLVGTEALVWFHDHEHHKASGDVYTVGHTKTHIKVVVPRDETLLDDILPKRVKFSAASKWHLEGTVISR